MGNRRNPDEGRTPIPAAKINGARNRSLFERKVKRRRVLKNQSKA
jgi:hypothetical protein